MDAAALATLQKQLLVTLNKGEIDVAAYPEVSGSFIGRPALWRGSVPALLEMKNASVIVYGWLEPTTPNEQ